MKESDSRWKPLMEIMKVCYKKKKKKQHIWIILTLLLLFFSSSASSITFLIPIVCPPYYALRIYCPYYKQLEFHFIRLISFQWTSEIVNLCNKKPKFLAIMPSCL